MHKNKEGVETLAKDLVEVIWKFGTQGMDKQCCGALSVAEYKAMSVITAIRSCSVQDVGTQLGFTKSGATRIVNRLEKKGFITKERSEQDNRVCCLEPTLQGQTSLKNATQEFTASIEVVLNAMPKDQRANLSESLGVMAKAIQFVG